MFKNSGRTFIGVTVLIFVIWLAIFMGKQSMAEPTYQSDRLFTECGSNYHKLAQKIERKEEIDVNDVRKVDDINKRCGEDITLLFHAVSFGNLSAVDALLASGADVTMTDKATGSQRDFVYFLTLPGGPLIDQDGINEMIKMYLKHGGDPNYRLQGQSQEPLIAGVATGSNIDGVRILLDAGADPWANANSSFGEDNAMNNLAYESHEIGNLDEFIDEGYFNNLTQKQLFGILGSVGSYSQRGDEISKEIQRIAKRILKRNPNYQVQSDYDPTQEIFKNHYNDPPAVIPWDEINSDAVQ